MDLQLPIDDAGRDFEEAAEAATRGERVVLTKGGRPVAELIPASAPPEEGFFEKLKRVRKELGLEGMKIELPDDFDDPAFSRAVLGLED